MGETLECIRTRRACRNFKSDAVDAQLVAKVCEAGSWAASGLGRQSPRIIAITNKEIRRKFQIQNAMFMGKQVRERTQDANNQVANQEPEFDPFYGAPVIILVIADTSMPTYIYDGSLVIGNMMLAAHDLGLASCWIHRAKEEIASEEGKALLREWGIEGNYEGIGHLALGYAACDLGQGAERKADYVTYVN